MKINLDGGELTLKFFYSRKENKAKQNIPIATHCALIEKLGATDAKMYIGIAYLHPREIPNKEVGRKIALERALEKGNFNREERREIWEQYFGR